MIITDETRRYYELRFFYIMTDIFNKNNDLRDCIILIEAIAIIGRMDDKPIKTILTKMYNDRFFLATRDEITYLAYRQGKTKTKLAKEMGVTKKTIDNRIKKMDNYYPRPRLEIKEIYTIMEFLEIFDFIKGVGI